MTKNKTNDPVITLSSFKHAAFQSHDSECFDAIVCVDGEQFCRACDDGWGGEIGLNPLKQGITNTVLHTLIFQVARRYNPNCVISHNDAEITECPNFDEWEAYNEKKVRSGKVTSYEVFIHLVGQALTRAMYGKDLKKAMTKKVVWLDASDGKIYNSRNAKNAAHRNAMADRIKENYADCTILNGMNFDAALSIFIDNVEQAS